MALYERAHVVYLRNVEAKIDEPALKKLVGRIVNDEDRHAKFFDSLVAHCVEQHRDSTIAAIARRAPAFPVIGGDILEYRDSKLRTVADAGIFDQAAADEVVSDAIVDWGLGDEPQLKKFVRA
jgi:acyl-[acyl-carrier-protein] desaturase